jgi:hypothetical protein
MYGRNVDDRTGVLKEILPVIGGAFLWRTFARAAVGLFPPLFSALPKTAIAYAGTYVVGQAAAYYYERGHKPPPETLQQMQAEALRRYRAINDRLKRTPDPRAESQTPPPS